MARAQDCIKIEGAGKVGERCYVIMGVRDPQTISNIDQAIAWAKQKVEAWYGPIGQDYQLYYHVYGKNAVMGELETVPAIQSHELGIAVEVIAPELALAEKIVTLAARGIFYARLPTKGTAGGGAFLTEDVLVGSFVSETSCSDHSTRKRSTTSMFRVAPKPGGRGW